MGWVCWNPDGKHGWKQQQKIQRCFTNLNEGAIFFSAFFFGGGGGWILILNKAKWLGGLRWRFSARLDRFFASEFMYCFFFFSRGYFKLVKHNEIWSDQFFFLGGGEDYIIPHVRPWGQVRLDEVGISLSLLPWRSLRASHDQERWQLP